MRVSSVVVKYGPFAPMHREKFSSVISNFHHLCLLIDDTNTSHVCISCACCDKSLSKLGLKVFFKPALEFFQDFHKSPIM